MDIIYQIMEIYIRITGIKKNQSQGSMNDLWGFIILLEMWSINELMKLHNIYIYTYIYIYIHMYICVCVYMINGSP